MEHVFLAVIDQTTGFVSVVYSGELARYLAFYKRERYRVIGQYGSCAEAEASLRKYLKTAIVK
jgi:hypothetical protein